MSATNHTPGPWSAWGTGRNWMIRGGAGQVTGNVAQTLPRPEFGQEAANARLIAKAPEMYELLEKITIPSFRGPALMVDIYSEARRIKAEIDDEAKHGEG